MDVSSPGLGRPFRKDKDFERNIGEEVELKLYKPVEHKKDYVGLLNAYDKDTVTIGLEDGSEKVFERRDIAVIRQTVYF